MCCTHSLGSSLCLLSSLPLSVKEGTRVSWLILMVSLNVLRGTYRGDWIVRVLNPNPDPNLINGLTMDELIDEWATRGQGLVGESRSLRPVFQRHIFPQSISHPVCASCLSWVSIFFCHAHLPWYFCLTTGLNHGDNWPWIKTMSHNKSLLC